MAYVCYACHLIQRYRTVYSACTCRCLKELADQAHAIKQELSRPRLIPFSELEYVIEQLNPDVHRALALSTDPDWHTQVLTFQRLKQIS